MEGTQRQLDHLEPFLYLCDFFSQTNGMINHYGEIYAWQSLEGRTLPFKPQEVDLVNLFAKDLQAPRSVE